MSVLWTKSMTLLSIHIRAFVLLVMPVCNELLGRPLAKKYGKQASYKNCGVQAAGCGLRIDASLPNPTHYSRQRATIAITAFGPPPPSLFRLTTSIACKLSLESKDLLDMGGF